MPEERAPAEPDQTEPAQGAAVPWLVVPALVALAVHLVALYLPGGSEGSFDVPWLPGADKVVHVLLFAAPVYLLGLLTRRVGLVAGLFVGHAVLSELIQWRFIPYRDGDPWDLLADLAGIGLAVLFLRWRPAGR